MNDPMKCRGCGCTDMQACEGGCWWVEPDLCSTCSARAKDLPILFKAEMVRAILYGTKTQTRRVVSRSNSYRDGSAAPAELWAALNFADASIFVDDGPSPAGNPGPYLHVPDTDGECRHRIYPRLQPGDRLWVKETWRPRCADGPMDVIGVWDVEVTYAADGFKRNIRDGEFGERDWTMPKAAARGNVSPLFMPRWASRISLEVTGVRGERLQDISEDDADAEGINGPMCAALLGKTPMKMGPAGLCAYSGLWDSINGAGAWDANPWVWVYEFKRVTP